MNQSEATKRALEIKSRFRCHQCGNCCRGDGYVSLGERDIDRLADFLDMARDSFLEQYADFDAATHAWRLKDQEDPEQSCIFLTPENGCRVHPAKPHQCEGFPFRWRSSNIEDYCEGWRAAAGLPPLGDKKTISS